MTPEQKGRFCASCKKTVVDFSSMTDRQLTEFFSGKKRNLCGRFHTDQLNRVIVLPPKPNSWLRPFVPLVLSALAVVFEACSPENKTVGKTGMSGITKDNPVTETEWRIATDSNLTKPADTFIQETSDEMVQVITRKNKTVHPAFIAADTMRLPGIDTLTKPDDPLDTISKPLLKPRKESFIMGRVSNTYNKAVEERRKKEQRERE
ncbi:MAG TPA: hypothetical protein VGN63_10245 [Flavisolibacter sp.]|nr:hypothetical protein [Flavisolibacter sp.]